MIRYIFISFFISSLLLRASTPYASMDELMQDFKNLDNKSPEHKCLKEGSFNECEKLMLKFNKAIYFHKMGEIISKSYNINHILRYIKIAKRTYGVTVYKKYDKLNQAKKRLQIAYRYQGTKHKNALDFKKSYLINPNPYDIKEFFKYANLPILEKNINFASNEKDKKIYRKLRTEKLLKKYRAKNSADAYIKAYKIGRYKRDLKKAIELSGEKELKELLSLDLGQKYLQNIKTKYLKILRSKDDFVSYILAYETSNGESDLIKASLKAKNKTQIAKIEKIIFQKIRSKEGLVDISLSLDKPTYDSSSSSGGFGSVSTRYGYTYITGKLNVKFHQNLPFNPQCGIYKIIVKLKINIPRHKRLRSKWLGNQDVNDDINIYKNITIKLKPPYRKISKTFSTDGITLAYFDRGSMGGYTAKWPTGDAHVKVENISVYFDGSDMTTRSILRSKNTNINFDNLKKFHRYVLEPTLTLTGIQNRGISMIKSFARSSQNSGYRTASNSSGGSARLCIPSIPKEAEYSKCSNARTASGKYATVQLSRSGGMTSNCFELKIYGGSNIAVGNTCGGANGQWSVMINGQSGFANGLGSAIGWLLGRM